MNKRYMSVHLAHYPDHNTNDCSKTNINSIDDSGKISDHEMFEYINHDLNKSLNHNARPHFKHPQEYAPYQDEPSTEIYHLFTEYMNEPELHISQIKDPFSNATDEIALINNEGEVALTLSQTQLSELNDVLEENFMDGQIFDYAYGATDDHLHETKQPIIEHSLNEQNYYQWNISNSELTVTVLGNILTIDENMESESWDIILDNQKFADLFVNAKDFILENNTLCFFDNKGNPQNINGYLVCHDGKVIDFEEIEAIIWYLT